MEDGLPRHVGRSGNSHLGVAKRNRPGFANSANTRRTSSADWREYYRQFPAFDPGPAAPDLKRIASRNVLPALGLAPMISRSRPSARKERRLDVCACTKRGASFAQPSHDAPASAGRNLSRTFGGHRGSGTSGQRVAEAGDNRVSRRVFPPNWYRSRSFRPLDDHMVWPRGRKIELRNFWQIGAGRSWKSWGAGISHRENRRSRRAKPARDGIALLDAVDIAIGARSGTGCDRLGSSQARAPRS